VVACPSARACTCLTRSFAQLEPGWPVWTRCVRSGTDSSGRPQIRAADSWLNTNGRRSCRCTAAMRARASVRPRVTWLPDGLATYAPGRTRVQDSSRTWDAGIPGGRSRARATAGIGMRFSWAGDGGPGRRGTAPAWRRRPRNLPDGASRGGRADAERTWGGGGPSSGGSSDVLRVPLGRRSPRAAAR